MKKAVLFICVLISIYSCNTKKKETDLEKMGLKADVISVITEGGFGSPILEFDNNGNLLRTIEYQKNDVDGIFSLTETSFLRDSTNKIIVEKIQDVSNLNLSEFEDFLITKKYNYLNDKLSNITYKTKYGDDILEKYKYENDVLVEIKEEFYSGNKDVRSSIRTTNYFYNKKNHLDSTIRIRIYEDGSIDSKSTEVYLPNGLLKSKKEFSNIFNDAKSILYFDLELTEYKYNGNNDLIEEKKTDLNKNEVTLLINYNYIYDGKNNWVQKTIIHDYFKFKDQYVEKRKIIYKGQNYSEDIAKYDLLILKYKSSSKELGRSSIKLEEESTSFSVFQNQDNDNTISNNTPQQKEKRKCYSCNGTGQCSKCSKPQRVRYKQGESPHDHNEIRQGMIVCHQCGGNLMDFGSDKNKSCYLCKASGWLNCRECNSNGNGSNIGKCQRCKGTGFDR